MVHSVQSLPVVRSETSYFLAVQARVVVPVIFDSSDSSYTNGWPLVVLGDTVLRILRRALTILLQFRMVDVGPTWPVFCGDNA